MANASDPSSTQKGKQKVSFAKNTKGESLSDDEDGLQQAIPDDEDESKPSGGIIGQLEIHRSGLIKMRLGDGIVMEVRTYLFVRLCDCRILMNLVWL